MTLPENKKQIKSKSEEEEERINIIDSGNVLGWIPTVLKGTDVETTQTVMHADVKLYSEPGSLSFKTNQLRLR